MPTKAELEAELKHLKAELEATRAVQTAVEDTVASPAPAASASAAPSGDPFLNAVEEVIADIPLQEMLDEVEGAIADNPKLSFLGALAVGVIIGHALGR
ncbi:hypothetical protein [Oceanomicrobium pacificus]|uniref:DUF883 domain-containing protein n=1 Tax=Oceanomicrobium pacificus TaxID=2692916 RepID=A0A6B0TVS0_9RHOB|nr:hypothetical protein [Oceanomicrobium pacificus]MXU65658.1 hypothetical protein [Oceanomicrobium pacificus]